MFKAIQGLSSEMGKNQRAVVVTLIIIWLFLIGKTIYQQISPASSEFQTLRRYHPGTKEYGEDRLAQIPQEFHTFWGRSLDEKRDLTTWEDLYRFLMWCKEKLPKGVDVGFLFSNSLYPHKAAYYLYPHNWRGDDVLLIFGSGVNHNYKVIAQYGKNKNIAIKISYLKKIMRDPLEFERWQPTLKPYLENRLR